MAGRPYSEDERAALTRLYPASPWQEILETLPGRSRNALHRQAGFMGLRRLRDASYPEFSTRTHPVFRQLREIRQRRRISRDDLAERIGYHPVMLTRWETGLLIPSCFALFAWCDGLGVSLKVHQEKADVEVGPKEGIKQPDLSKLMAGRA